MVKKINAPWMAILVVVVAAVAFGLGLVAAPNPSPPVLAEGSAATVKPAPRGLAPEVSPFVAIAKEVMPAVVNISAEKVVRMGRSFPFGFGFEDDPFFREFFRGFPQLERKGQSLGSGVVIDERGYIITNNHVVGGAEEIEVRLSDKSVYKGEKVKVIGNDPRTDVAVVKIDADHPLPTALLGDSDKMEVGEWVMAIGNPWGLDRTVTVGVISAKGRSGLSLSGGPTYQDFIQTDASINPGNSGGPLVNIKGEVIGINAAITSPSGGNVGIGFAVPVNMARAVAEQLISEGKIVRGYLGISPQEVSPELAEALRLESTEGVLVAKVEDNTPADRAGLEVEDVIVEFDGKEVTSVQKFRIVVAETPPGKEVKIVIVRNGRRKTLRAKIGEYPSAGEIEQQGGWLGIRAVSLDSQAARRYRVGQGKGVLVVEVEEDSPADDAGIRAGDVIKKIGSLPIENMRDYTRASETYRDSEKSLVLQLERGDMVLFLGVRPG